MIRQRAWAVWLVAAVLASPDVRAVEVGPQVERLRAVGPQGAGAVEAAAALKELSGADVNQIFEILAAFDGAGPIAANWLRAAVDTIAEQAEARGAALPLTELERFILDRHHDGRARRLAYEWLAAADSARAERLLPVMIDDPNLELRRDAVTRLDAEAAALEKAGRRDEALAAWREAFRASRDVDQVRRLAERLESLGQPVDIARHFGFVVEWKLLGPFDNTGGTGYERVEPPEREIDLRATYLGKHGPVAWKDHRTTDAWGKVDLNATLGEEKGVAAYAYAEFLSPSEREAQFRLASLGALKLWLNGQLIDAHHVYHSGSQLDQYVSRGLLRPGKNTILLKVCQNEQTQSWARPWEFQLRVCDATGAGILSTDGRE